MDRRHDHVGHMTTALPQNGWKSTRIVSDPDALADWEQLYTELGNTPLLHPDLIRAALNVFGRPHTRLVSFRAENKLLACAIVDSVDSFRLETFQPSQAPIGAWLQRSDISTEAILQSFVATQAPWIVSFGLTQQDPFLLAPPPQSPSLLVTDYIQTARISIDRPWDAYWKARGANLRHNIKRAKAKLAGVGSAFSLRVLDNVREMSEAVHAYGEIESRSWKASQGTAVSFDNDQGRYYVQLLEAFACRGKARCYQLVIGERVAATDLCVLGDDEIVILKTTYDEDFRDFSPAFLMREIAFQELFSSQQCKRIEFYGKVMDWHLRWTDEVRTMYHGTYFRYPGMLKTWQKMKTLRRVSSPGESTASHESSTPKQMFDGS